MPDLHAAIASERAATLHEHARAHRRVRAALAARREQKAKTRFVNPSPIERYTPKHRAAAR